MNVIMRKSSIPSHCYMKLFHKLQNLNQGSKSVEDYHKEMRIVMIQANVVKDKKATMMRFINWLN
jgi:hypothetical protein